MAVAIVVVVLSWKVPNSFQGEQRVEEPEVDEGEGGRGGADDEREETDDLNETEIFNGTTQQIRQGFLEEFMDRYTHTCIHTRTKVIIVDENFI